MNNLEKAFKEVSSIGQYSRNYFSYLTKVLDSIDENEINRFKPKLVYLDQENHILRIKDHIPVQAA